MKCLNCNANFEPRRKTAKYCSDTCRVYASRGIKKPTTVQAFLPKIAEKVAKQIDEEHMIRVAKKYIEPNILEKIDKPCKHGASPRYCKFARPGKPCK
jgi:hypothetical protein